MKKNLKGKLGIGLLIVFLMLVGGCSNTHLASKDKSISSIQTVLKNQFNGPDEELISLLEDPKNATFIGDTDKGSNNPKTTTELDKYFNKIYRSYFSENMYQKFTGAYAASYQTAAHNNNYRIKVENLKVSQDETNEDAYNFSLNVAYEGNGKNGLEEVTGRVHINDEGKIAKIQYFENKLLNILQSK